MNTRLQKMIDKGFIPNNETCFIDAYNQSVNTEITGTITARVDASNMVYVTEPKLNIEKTSSMKEFYGYARTRDTKGNVVNRHLNKYVNSLHTSVGSARNNMEVLKAEFDMNKIKQVGQISSSQNSRVIDTSGISYAVIDGEKGGTPKVIEPQVLTLKRIDLGKEIQKKYDAGVCQNFRIRKLTPRECFRLMGVTEDNIDKIQQSGVSQSQQYKMAGNSIVVDVLEHIFRKLFIDTHQESQQLSLF